MAFPLAVGTEEERSEEERSEDWDLLMRSPICPSMTSATAATLLLVLASPASAARAPTPAFIASQAAANRDSFCFSFPSALEGGDGYYNPGNEIRNDGSRVRSGRDGRWPENGEDYYYDWRDDYHQQANGEYYVDNQRANRQRRREYLRRELERLDREEQGERQGEYYALQGDRRGYGQGQYYERQGNDERNLPQQQTSANEQEQGNYYDQQSNFDERRLPRQYGSEGWTDGGYEASRQDDFWNRDLPSEPLAGPGFGGMPTMMDAFLDPLFDPFDPFGHNQRGWGMMSPFSSPWGVFAQMDQMMQQMNTQMTQRLGEVPSMQALLEEIRACLVADPTTRAELGESLSVGTPLGRSSGRSVVNGEARSREQLAVPVEGSRGQGIARVVADERGIQELSLDVEGRSIRVPLNPNGWEGGVKQRSGDSDDNGDFIDANVLDKEVH